MFQNILTSFHKPKNGNEENEYEDAFGSIKKIENGTQVVRAAVADGATECSFAADWAKMLVNCYVERAFRKVQDIQEQIESLSKDWYTIINRPLPYYAERKARMGASSTILGVEISSDPSLTDSGRWEAIAVGDSCLFHISDDSLNLAFPIKKSEDFNNSPYLISSNLRNNRSCWSNVMIQNGNWQAGDIFILATDALAAWFIHEHETGGRPWDELSGFIKDSGNNNSFETWLNEKRTSSSMKNDDVICLIIKL